jgi:hypothetical protein
METINKKTKRDLPWYIYSFPYQPDQPYGESNNALLTQG